MKRKHNLQNMKHYNCKKRDDLKGEKRHFSPKYRENWRVRLRRYRCQEKRWQLWTSIYDLEHHHGCVAGAPTTLSAQNEAPKQLPAHHDDQSLC